MVYLCFRNFMLGENHSYPDNGQFKRPIFQKDAPCPARPGACSLQSRLLLLLPLRGRGRRVPWHLLRLNRWQQNNNWRVPITMGCFDNIKSLKRADSNSGLAYFRVVFWRNIQEERQTGRSDTFQQNTCEHKCLTSFQAMGEMYLVELSFLVVAGTDKLID